MRVAVRDHDGKVRHLVAALEAAGHEMVPDFGDVALLDADLPAEPFTSLCDHHDRVLIYPHGGGNPMAGPEWPTHRNTICRFVPGTGQADVLATVGYPVETRVIGWPFSDRRPFRPASPVRVLFAPCHQLRNGWIPADCSESNARVHDLLAALPLDLTVRVPKVTGNDLPEVGISPREDVTYQEGTLDLADAIAAIEQADVVVAAEGTFPSLAIALGVPTVMTCQFAPEEDGLMGPLQGVSWWAYKDDARYPLDADECQTPEGLSLLLGEAAVDDRRIADWRRRFVGEQFDPARFVTLFEEMTS